MIPVYKMLVLGFSPIDFIFSAFFDQSNSFVRSQNLFHIHFMFSVHGCKPNKFYKPFRFSVDVQ